MICGDFNFHVNDTANQNSDACNFIDLLETVNMIQHVSTPTQRKGHILDLIITRNDETFIQDVRVQAPVVQTSDSAIHRINHYPADSVIHFRNTYPLDSDLSGASAIQRLNNRGLDEVYSDHSVVVCKLNCPKPPPSRVLVNYRANSNHSDKFSSDLLNSVQQLANIKNLNVSDEDYNTALNNDFFSPPVHYKLDGSIID